MDVKKFSRAFLVFVSAVVLVSFIFDGTALVYKLPHHNTNLKYFYVFGKDGDKLMGKEDSVQEIIIDVPE